MVRRARIFLDHGIYHVYCRVTRGDFVFQNTEDAESFVDTARNLIDIDRVFVLAWCLMSNHYHMVIQTSSTPLWRSMLRFQPRVSRSHNKRRRVFGPLWQSRYQARLVQDEIYYRQVIAYVHLNPLQAGLVSDPADWQWSGHAAMIGRRKPVLVDVGRALRGFGENPCQAQQNYLESVKNVAELRLDGDVVHKLPWWKQVKNQRQLVAEDEVPDGAKDWLDLPVFREMPPPGLSEIIYLCGHESGCPVDDICGKTNAPKAAIAREIIARLAVDGFGYRVVEVAKLLRKHPDSLSRWRSRKMTDRSKELFERVTAMINQR